MRCKDLALATLLSFAFIFLQSDVKGQDTIFVSITTDCWGGEVSWELRNPSNTIIGSIGSGTLGNGVTVVDTIVTSDIGCYTFTIFDTYGDGLNGSAYGGCGVDGDYILTDNLGNTLTQMTVADYGSSSSHVFSYPSSAGVLCNDCTSALTAVDGLNDIPSPNLWYTYTPPINGQYKITTCGLASCDTKIWMYDYCNMANFDDTEEATLIYNDDSNCGVQAEVTTILQGGQTYWLRVGDTGSDCGSSAFQFEISYIGGVVGCMEPTACNYLPIATEPATCYFEGDVQCPSFGPDLVMIGSEFYDSMYFTTLNSTDQCLIDEGCNQGFGTREVIRFTTWIKNIGTEDYFIGDPNDQPDQFEFDACHNHWHYEGYAEYRLYDDAGDLMPEIGFKNGFCVLDLECSDGGQAKYNCGNMGITAQCGDIYSSGLSCQWIDVTNVPAGSYTFVIGTNWDESPDANGSYELAYDNNYAAVCVSFERDATTGALINFTKDPNCSVVLDCQGIPWGNTQPDCVGNCPGIVATGDLDNSGELELTDLDEYISGILGNDALVSPCTDLDADNEITVTDAAVAAGCVFYGPDHVDEEGIHDHCVWNNEVTNPAHNVTLSVGDINEEEGYVDIHVLNPDNRIVGYEFTVSGMSIQSVENLADPVDYDITPQASLGGTRVIGLSFNDQSLPKHTVETPLCRIYYFSLAGGDVCVSNVVDIVNEDYHNTMTTIGACSSPETAGLAQFSADFTSVCQGGSVQYTDESLGTATAWDWTFEGGNPSSSTDQHPMVTYDAPGTFAVSLTVTTTGSVQDSEVKTGFITAAAATTYYADTDGDSYGDPNAAFADCATPTGYVINALDCDDTNADIYDGAPGQGLGIDNNCDGVVDGTELAACVGDVTGDGQINVSDILAVLAGFGCAVDCGPADINNDGAVNSSDILALLAGFGTVCP